ncbi:MAG: hypothetical protein GXP37_14790 [Chloroflexi bacterium]|nr:hypothetical protein [Chloroflexota bacterium]
MKRNTRWLLLMPLLTVLFILSSSQLAVTRTNSQLAACADFAFSTEEDFLSQGPVPADGNPIISDGDLLSRNGVVCMRNNDLLRRWDSNVDLGLDAADVLQVDQELVAFSTSLNDPQQRFTAGDLLSTWGMIIPNQALLTMFQINGDRGLDAVHFVGSLANIIAFNQVASQQPRSTWLENPSYLVTLLKRHGVDIWFSIEGTERLASTQPIYDGDLLSAAYGVIVARNANLLPVSVPAGIPLRGVDFGLDAFSAPRLSDFNTGYFSTEILNRGKPSFSDGDILQSGNGIYLKDIDLVQPFEPKADFLGVDALFIHFRTGQTSGYLPLLLKDYLWRAKP